MWPSIAHVVPNPFRRRLADGYDALLVALAGAGNVALVQVQISWLQADQFRHAHAARVEHLDQRLVPQTPGRGDLGLREQPIHLLEVEEPRERRPRSRSAEILGRTLLIAMLERDEAVKAANARDRAG